MIRHQVFEICLEFLSMLRFHIGRMRKGSPDGFRSLLVDSAMLGCPSTCSARTWFGQGGALSISITCRRFNPSRNQPLSTCLQLLSTNQFRFFLRAKGPQLYLVVLALSGGWLACSRACPLLFVCCCRALGLGGGSLGSGVPPSCCWPSSGFRWVSRVEGLQHVEPAAFMAQGSLS